MTTHLDSSLLALSRLVALPTIVDERGGLGFVESERHVPFDVKRVYYLYQTTAGSSRGAHAHKLLEQVVIAGSGSFVVTLDDGVATRRFELTSPSVGLYIPRMLWRDLSDFSADAFCLVLASEYYDEADYYRSYADYRSARGL